MSRNVQENSDEIHYGSKAKTLLTFGSFIVTWMLMFLCENLFQLRENNRSSNTNVGSSCSGFAKHLLPSFVHLLPLSLSKEWTAYRIHCKFIDPTETLCVGCSQDIQYVVHNPALVQHWMLDLFWRWLKSRWSSISSALQQCYFVPFHADALFFLSYLWRGAIYVVLHFS